VPSAGFDSAAVFMPHPALSQTAAELRRMAEESAAEIGHWITSPP
jgi:hypothetical protein